MTSASTHLPARPATGASLMELMVGLVICLLISLAAAKSAELFNTMQRQGVATSAGSSNALSALSAIKEDVAAGGMGFFASGSYRCTNLNLSVGTNVVANNAGFFPVQATRIGDNDRIDVVYAQDVAAGAWTELQEVSNGATATLKTMLPVTVAQQPAVLLARNTGNLNSPCLVRTVTASVDPTAGVKQSLTFAATGTHNQGVFTTTPDFLLDEPVILLGRLNWNRYELEGTNLVINRRLDNTKATLLPNVIAFRVQYGVTNASTSIENWRNPDEAGWTAISNLNAPQVRALRIGVVIRSTQRDKECDAAPVNPVLFKGTPEEISITPPGPNANCYRYRTAELVAPLRNLVSGTTGITWPTTQIVPTP